MICKARAENEISYKKMTQRSGTILLEYTSKSSSDKVTNLRFFSYGSNMNEGKFRRDTKKSGYEFGLENVRTAVLRDYERVLGNRSKYYGCAFTICPSEGEQVEGICHDVPIEGLEAFLTKEGVLLDEPSYELMIVTISTENNPVLTLKGLKPASLKELDCRGKLRAFHYVNVTIEGAERWEVDCSDFVKIRDWLEKELCG